MSNLLLTILKPDMSGIQIPTVFGIAYLFALTLARKVIVSTLRIVKRPFYFRNLSNIIGPVFECN